MLELEKVVEFLEQVGNLKKTFRFKSCSPELKESSADHSWRLALAAYMVSKQLNLGIDAYHAMQLAVIHDIPEAITDDIDSTLVGKVISKEQKRINEQNAMKKLSSYLPEEFGREIYDMWVEFENCQTEEAKYVNALDKLETLSHLVTTGWRSYDDADHIAFYADESVRNFPQLIGVLKIIKKKLRLEYEKWGVPWKQEYNYGL